MKMPWPLRRLPQSATPLQLPATAGSYLTEMMRLAEDGVMFTIARFENALAMFQRRIEIFRAEHDPDDLDNDACH
jgi:hypothetical protein